MRFSITALVVSAAFATAGSAQVMDFQDLEHNDGNINDHGSQYDQNGFRLSKDPNEPFPFATFGTQESRYPGSTALFNNTVGGITILTEAEGGLFSLRSIDLANLNLGGPVTVNFTGFISGGGTVEASFTTSFFDQNVLETFSFVGFDGLERVEWSQDSQFHQFDNINMGPRGCYADCTEEGTLDLFDFLCFVNSFNAGDDFADCDANGFLDLFDFLCFVNAFNAGC